MTYILTLEQQTKIFLQSVGFGFLLGFIYDAVRVFRIAFFKSRKSVFVSDVLFLLICAFLSFLFFLVVNNGRFRGYAVAGELIGFFIYYFSLGTIAIRISDALVKAIQNLFKLLKKIFLCPLRFAFKKIGVFCKKTGPKARKSTKKIRKNLKFLLKCTHGMLYNLYGVICPKRAYFKRKRESKNAAQKKEKRKTT